MINLLILLFIILLFHYSFFLISVFKGLLRLKTVRLKKPPEEFISIIIPFRNEEENIEANLKSIEAQNYPEEKYEVIYVDDSSNDNSSKILKESINNKNIKILTLAEKEGVTARKKRAVNFGIENSAGDIIVTTDADCFYSPGWLTNLVSTFDKTTGFVSGPVEFNGQRNIFSALQKIEFAGLILTGAGLIEIGQPVICNAANIAYRKNIFNEMNGFEDQMHISSGDDGLLMQKIHKSKKYKVKFCLNRDAVVRTKPLSSFIQFYRQRKRWASKNIFYDDKKLILKLISIFFFYLSLIVQIILGFLSSSIFFLSLLLSFFTKVLLEYLILQKGKEMLFPELEMKYFLIAELLQIPYIIIASIGGLFGNFIWKGRKIKR